jgi:hypothetical protein
MSDITAPAAAPCASCPYRRDVPEGVWSENEYDKLPPYDDETAHQPVAVFMCHQQDGRVCAGWAGCHDMNHALAVRMLAFTAEPDVLEAILDYETDVQLWDSGQQACDHGKSGIARPGPRAVRMIEMLEAKQLRQGGGERSPSDA